MMLLLCAITSGVWADETKFELVTSKSDLEENARYLIVSAEKDVNYYYAMGKANNNNRAVSVVSVAADNTITLTNLATKTSDEAPYAVTLQTFETGSWKLRDAVANKYLNGGYKSGSKNYNYIKTESSADGTKGKWTISFDASGNVTIKNGNNYYIQYNSSNALMGSYTSAQKAVKLYKEVVASSFTLTGESNNTSYGTVAVSGNKITATVADGCRYATPAYTVTKGEATVAQDGNVFTVTADADCTVRINFEQIPSHTLSYIVNPEGAGAVTLGATAVREGSSTTITASANAGYRFSNWTFSGEGAGLDDENAASTTVSMGTENVVVTANFDAVTTYAINWSVNGVVVGTTNVEENTNITFSAPDASTIPTGYDFVGWSEAEVAVTDAKPALVSSAKSTANKTYYAVLAIATASEPTLTKLGSDYNVTVGDNLVFVAKVDETKIYGMYQETTSSSYVKNFSFAEDVDDIAADAKKYWTVVAGSSDGTFKLGDTTNGYLYTSGSNNLSVDNSNSTDWTFEKNADGTFKFKGGGSNRYVSCRTDLSGTNQYLYRMAGSTPAGVYSFTLYKYVAGNYSYSGYCTTATPKVIAAYADGWMSYVAAADVEFPSEVEAYIVTSTETGITREKVTQAPKDTPLVLHATDGAKTYDLTALAAAPAALTQNKLKASDGTLTVTNDNYKKIYVLTVVGDEPGFGPLKMGSTLKAGKVYLEFAEAQAKDFIGFGEETTGIEQMEKMRNGENEKMPMFNLAGQRVGKSYKGIVIVNGKKYVNK